jgi:hypothetical protein
MPIFPFEYVRGFHMLVVSEPQAVIGERLPDALL